MKSVEAYLKGAVKVSDCLANEGAYLAHLPPPNTDRKAETLAGHLELVFKYFAKLVEENSLDKIIDNLIGNIVREILSGRKEEIEAEVKRLFADTVVFHDHGKINENFQAERMLNSQFKKVATPIKPSYGHAELGAFIYCAYQLEGLKELVLPDDEVNFLAMVAFVLVNSITLHHSAELVAPFEKLAKTVFVQQHDQLAKYLTLYGFEKPALTTLYFENLEGVFDSVSFSPSQSFSLYALSRLNFSLLTAADYLATSEYMSGQEVKNLGLITDSLRKKVISAARLSKAYNTKAYELADASYTINNPSERSGSNLNLLRQNIAVDVIRTIRQKSNERLFYLEAPTGSGKTNLSMLAVAELLEAHREINKVFYVFPFTTLITQTYLSIIETLGLSESDISLLHSKAGFQSAVEDDDYGGKKLDYLNNLFVHYPFCLLTHIRFFDMLKTNEKETNYLLHRLANSIVVIDELQSYPPRHWDKMLYFIRQYAAAFNVRFILMSATLPKIDKLNLPFVSGANFTELLPGAGCYFTNPNFCDRVKFRFDYRNQKLEMAELAEIVLQKSTAYTKRNNQEGVFTIIEFIFKKSATEFSEAVGEHFFDKVFVLSGTILEPRRREIINYLKNKGNRNQKVLLITTQVVEAGVDIDMDLGFKNVSLIDSDEQLAGRVNRNVLKQPCEVFLFQINQPSLLYRQDERYIITRDFISHEEHEEILKTKDFHRLYDVVLARIDKVNAINELQNFASDYLPEIASLNYRQVHRKFKLIDQGNISVFVPLKLPRHILSPKDEPEEIFSKSELAFLSTFGVETEQDWVSGEDVWKVYKAILCNQDSDFTQKQIDKKIISGILSKFTFSIFANEKMKRTLEVSFGFPSNDKENELRGFENYIYLAHYTDCYDYERGLVESRFGASENFIL